ncbi:MAG: cellulose biosynthesis cyclic di-GMP-binding regulatory protein BcsB [Pseudomonadota bacterium]
MRLIGIGLLSFMLAATAILISNSTAISLGTRELSELFFGPHLRFEADNRAPRRIGQAEGAAVQRVAPDTPIILSGLPSYQNATFLMPIDARPLGGYLQIDATLQVLAGVEGVLRIAVGNSRRAELLLRPGESERSMRIDLTAEDLTRDRLVVSFSLQGEGPHSPCGIDRGREAVVEIESTSAVFLTFDALPESDRDRVRMAGRQVQVAWPDDQRDRMNALLAAADLNSQGVVVRFDDDPDAVSPVDLNGLLAQIAPNHGPGQPTYAWSEAMAPASGLYALRRFHRSHTWRIPYAMGLAESASLPAALHLDMELSRQAAESRWHVVVTLNGQLLEQRLLAPGEVELRAEIALPASLHQQRNVVEITANTDHELEGVCTTGPELFAALGDASRLEPGPVRFLDPLMELRRELGPSDGWRIDVSEEVTKVEAGMAADLLSALAPHAAAIDAASRPTLIHVLHRGADLDAWSSDTPHHHWLVFQDEDGRLVARRLADHNASETSTVMLLAVVDGVT